jgi:two-component system, cell cycle response regulator
MLERALIVDDAVPLHRLIRSQLHKEHLEFHSAYNGPDGLSMAASLRPSLILLDVDMSEMDGFEVWRRLKASAATTTIPVIFLTADFEIKDKITGLNMGAVDYVTKPFKPEELSARVRASLRAKHSLDQKATVDGLTGLRNRKYLEEQLAVQITQESRSGRPVAYIAGDLDGLKRINARYGIPLGDEAIRSVGNILSGECRAEDAVCHLEGGTFGILVSVMGRAGAGRLADRLCKLIQEKLLVVHGKQVGVTCSFGVADSLVAGEGSLVERATAALRGAKLNGGSCVSIARPLRSRRVAAA